MRVRCLKSFGQLDPETQHVNFRERTGSELCVQRHSGEEFHNQEVDTIIGIELVDGLYIWVV